MQSKPPAAGLYEEGRHIRHPGTGGALPYLMFEGGKDVESS